MGIRRTILTIFFPLTSPVENRLQNVKNDQICSQSQNHPFEVQRRRSFPILRQTLNRPTNKSSTDPQRTLATDSSNKPPSGFHIRNILRQKGKRSHKTDPTNPLADPQRTFSTDSHTEPFSGPQSGP